MPRRPADTAEPAPERDSAEQTGIQSVETGMRILTALASLTAVGSPPMLKTLAEHAGMPPAKAHRYVVSLARSGLVEKEPLSGRYRLGPMARQIGIVALQSLDVMRLAIQQLPVIRERMGHTVALAIWAHHGPTIVLVEEVWTSVTVSIRVGQIMPLLSSATGRAFGAWAPRALTEPRIAAELTAGPGARPASRIRTAAQAEALFRGIRGRGIASVEGDLNPLIHALSAPVFDFRGVMVGALSSLGPSTAFDTDPQGRLGQVLRQAAADLSHGLGCHTPEPGQALPPGPASSAGPAVDK